MALKSETIEIKTQMGQPHSDPHIKLVNYSNDRGYGSWHRQA